ncbi:MAG: hypothetical protein KF858_02050 [Candidatus Sumerlaeia bacterium]|nr:hypothetical protein [Candidatus Sumerlaeia bacterium]
MTDHESSAPAPHTSGLPPSLFVAAVVLILVLVLALVLTSFQVQWKTRAMVARAHRDMRTLATAIEAYYVDCMQYPAMTLDRHFMPDRDRIPPGVPPGRTFHAAHTTGLSTITTPVAYMVRYPVDPFTRPHGLTYRYYRQRSGWMLGSYGPDADMHTGGQLLWYEGDIQVPGTHYGRDDVVLPDATIERVYDPYRLHASTQELLGGSGPNGAYTYDPTNGIFSAGDVWRVKN